MLTTNETVKHIDIPRSLVAAGQRDRRLVLRIRAIAALRRVGWVVEPTFTDDEGVPIPEEQARALAAAVEPAVRELSRGRAAHARRTIAELESAQKSDEQQVDDLLDTVYQAQARGERSREVLDAFLDTLERWQNREGAPRIDRLFERVELERAPESLGILLLATTRLTRGHFARREAFIDRLRSFLIGRAGRSERRIDDILRGLRE